MAKISTFGKLGLLGLILLTEQPTPLMAQVTYPKYRVTICVKNMTTSDFWFQAKYDKIHSLDQCEEITLTTQTFPGGAPLEGAWWCNSDILIYEDCPSPAIHKLGIYPVVGKDHVAEKAVKNEYFGLEAKQSVVLNFILYYGAPNCPPNTYCTQKDTKEEVPTSPHQKEGLTFH